MKPLTHRKEKTMKSRKNNILNLLIVSALAIIGSSATETFAATIDVGIRARLTDPLISIPILLRGEAVIDVSSGVVSPGAFILHDARGGPAHAEIHWSTGSVDSAGRFRLQGQGVAQWRDSSGIVRYRHFRMVIRGRTNGTTRARGGFRDISGSSGAHLRGRFRH